MNIPVVWLELLGVVEGVVDEGKSSGLAASKLGLEAVGNAHIRGGAVHLGELFTDVLLADGGLSWVEDVNDHLFPLLIKKLLRNCVFR